MANSTSQQGNANEMHYKPTMIPKLERLNIPNVSEDEEQIKLSRLAGDNAKWYRHLRKYMAVFYKAKNILVTQKFHS